MRRRSRHWHDEPDWDDLPDRESWCGFEFASVAGYTEGGAPYGTTVEEFRESNRRDARREPRVGWAHAKEVLRRVLRERGLLQPVEDIGRVTLLAEGLSYRVFTAECYLPRGGSFADEPLVARLPYPGALAAGGDEHLLAGGAEAALLERLASLQLPLRLPRVVGTCPTEHGTAMVETFVDGLPLDLRAGRHVARPWELIAEAAAACHGIDPAGVRGLVPEHATRRDHAAAALRRVATLDLPEAAAVAAWGEGRLPPPTPARLLHGDLLGQNVLRRIPGFIRDDAPGAPRLGLIDWQRAALGDPAADLAIVTRGVARPFHAQGGLNRLVEAYEARTGAGVTAAQIRLHEACAC